MSNTDEILMEQYFRYINMNRNKRNFFLNLIMITKDICDSDVMTNSHDISSYDILFLNFINNNGVIVFDGGATNGYTNKLIHGSIVQRANKFCVSTNVYICNDFILDYDKKEYHVTDEFVFKDNKVVRRSRYDDGVYSESEVSLLSNEEMENYLQTKCNEMKLKM